MTATLSLLLTFFAVAAPLILSCLLILLIIAWVAGWLLFGPGPRRARAYRKAQRLLHQGDWQQALALIKEQQSARLPPLWQGRLRSAEGECHHAAAEACLRQKNYDESLRHFQTAAELLNLDAAELRARVVDTMLAEIRQQFAACKSAADNQAVQQLLGRVHQVQPSCPEATFWQGLCHVREGNIEAAMAALLRAHEEAGKRFIDPPLYLGTLKVRQGQMQEGLRLLGEANRVDTNCPLVALEIGVGIVAANGDSSLASRALQRALGSRGLAPWTKRPERLWAEAFPEGLSYIQRLAQKHSFVCPVLGSDVASLVHQGEFALAQAEYRQGHYQQAADLYAKLLQDSPPSAPLVRGLGLSLTRLERYDQAYKHLRAALDLEETKDPLTAGYLALCGARGKPLRDEDRVRNVEWAISLLGRFSLPGNAEWAHINCAVFAEVRNLGLTISVEDQVRLCETLRSVDAVDPDAAAAYAHLAAISTESVRPEYAWLYCRAAQLHGYTSDQDLQLFAKTFRDEASARAFYTARQWDMEEIAYTYLERCAAQRPGSFPAEFGPNYPQRGEAMLLERSARLEASGQPDAALATAEVLHQLAPHSLPAHDHLARLHYRRGALERAAELLATWEQLAPANHQPAVRRAIIEQQRGNNKERSIAIRRALESSHGSQRAAIAFLGARLSLSVLGRPPSSNGQAEQQEIVDWDEAKELLLVCLQEAPDHAEALSWLAAVRVVNGDQSGLAEQALRMDRPDVAEPHFHYLAAVCHLAAEDYARVLQAGRRALGSADAALAVECEYVMGWAHWRLGDPSTAAAAFEKLAQEPSSPSAEYARAAAASLAFQRGDYKQAARWWQAVHPRWRSEWGLDEPLRQTVFLSGLLAHSAGQYEEAADRLQEADRLGLRDRRIGPLLILNLVKAGQALLSGAEEEPAVYPVIQD